MKTSEQWWEETKSDPVKLKDWLVKQYHGEVTAAERIERYALSKTHDEVNVHLLNTIAEQERTHAYWVRACLETRGVYPQDINHTDRYWNETLGKIESFEDACAVAALAENMRLERIRVIANDSHAPGDIRQTFQKILKDEIFHEKAFRRMTDEKALERALAGHQKGLESLGLIMTKEVL